MKLANAVAELAGHVAERVVEVIEVGQIAGAGADGLADGVEACDDLGGEKAVGGRVKRLVTWAWSWVKAESAP